MTKARTNADNASADIQGVTAGTGLSGGGTSGTVTLTNDMATSINAKGDLVVGTANDTYSRLAVASTAGYVLTVDSAEATGLKWAAPSTPAFIGCSLYDAVNKSITNATFNLLTFPSEQFDTNGFHSTTTNTSRITIPTGLGGYYLVSGNLRFATNGTGSRVLMLRKNGSDLLTISEYAGTASANATGRGTLIYNFAAGDYLEVLAYQNSGGNLTLYAREEETPFQVQFLGV